MKKFTVSIFLLFVLFVSVPAFAVVTQTPEKAPVSITIPTDPKTITPGNMPCPMMQGGQGMMYNNPQMMQGSNNMMNGNCPKIQSGRGMMNSPMNKGLGMMKFRNKRNCILGLNRGPKLFMWIGMGIKFVAFLLFWILLIILLVMLIKWALKPHHLHMMHCCNNNSSLEILKERLAKGEITAEQYDELKAKIS